MRVLVAAEKVLDAGAGGGEPYARRLRFLGHDAHPLEQCFVAVAELAGGRECAGLRQQQLDALLARRSLREQAECFAEPVRCTCRRARSSCLSGLAQARDCGGVALTCRQLDVMGARRCR